MTRQYQYVGPAEIAARVSGHGGVVVTEKLKDSLRAMDGYQSGESLIVTFVVALNSIRNAREARCKNRSR